MYLNTWIVKMCNFYNLLEVYQKNYRRFSKKSTNFFPTYPQRLCVRKFSSSVIEVCLFDIICICAAAANKWPTNSVDRFKLNLLHISSIYYASQVRKHLGNVSAYIRRTFDAVPNIWKPDGKLEIPPAIKRHSSYNVTTASSWTP